jgi:hypothetical protein
MMSLDYYLQGRIKSFIYEMKSQMAAELRGHIFDAALQIKNDGTMF